jgi:uncharacterized membrane protein (DUF485 family)
LTPSVGAATDIAPVGRTRPPPAHEQTAAEDPQITDWNKVAGMEEFRALLKAKLKFIAPATVFFVVYYFALPVLVGYAPALMETKVFGVVNLAYIFALSQFIMAWVIAALYVRAAGRFDKMAAAILAKLKLK